MENLAPTVKDTDSVHQIFNSFTNLEQSSNFNAMNQTQFQETKFLTLKKGLLGLASTLDDSNSENSLDTQNGLQAKLTHVSNSDGDAQSVSVSINGGTSTVSPAMFAGTDSLSVLSMSVKKSDVTSL